MEDIFRLDIYYLIISNVALTPKEKDFLQYIYDNRHNKKVLNTENITELDRLYRLALECIEDNLNTMEYVENKLNKLL